MKTNENWVQSIQVRSGRPNPVKWIKWSYRIDLATICSTGARFDGKAYRAALLDGKFDWRLGGKDGYHETDSLSRHKTLFYMPDGTTVRFRRIIPTSWRFDDGKQIEDIIDIDLLKAEWAKPRLRPTIKAQLQSVFHSLQWKDIKSIFEG